MYFLNPPRQGRLKVYRPKGFGKRRRRRKGRNTRRPKMAKRRRKRSGGRTASGRFKKGHRTRGRKRRSGRGRRRRSSSRRRRPASRRRHRRTSSRRPRSRRRRRGLASRGWTHHKVNVWRKGRRYRQGSRRGMLRGHRVNPPLIPSLSSVKGIVRQGAFATLGWVGVNAVKMLVNRFGVLGFAAGQSPLVQALIDTGVRVLAVPVVAYATGMIVKNGSDRSAVVLGASANAVYNGVKNVGAASGQMPAWGAELLLGDSMFADYLTMGDYVRGFEADGMPITGNDMNPLISADGSFT